MAWKGSARERDYMRAYHKVYNHLPERAAYLENYRQTHREHLKAARAKNEQDSAALLGMTATRWKKLRQHARIEARKAGVAPVEMYRRQNLLSIVERRRLGERNAL